VKTWNGTSASGTGTFYVVNGSPSWTCAAYSFVLSKNICQVSVSIPTASSDRERGEVYRTLRIPESVIRRATDECPTAHIAKGKRTNPKV